MKSNYLDLKEKQVQKLFLASMGYSISYWTHKSYRTYNSLMKLNSKQLRVSEPTQKEINEIKRNPIYLILDNVLDTYNIGSLFRLCDATGVTKMYICGDCDYPPSSRIHKASVGTENWVPWEKRDSALEVIKNLKSSPASRPEKRERSQRILHWFDYTHHKSVQNDNVGVQIISVEQSPKAISYKQLATSVKFPCAIVIGHETHGVSKEVLEESDLIVELPMYGINKSFNVWGSAAVVIYKILESSK